MAIEFPHDIGTLEERLALLEDPEFAEALARRHPLHYPNAAFAPAPLGRAKRFGSIALAITAAASLVAGSLLVPIFSQKAAPRPHVTMSVAPARHLSRAPAKASPVKSSTVSTPAKHAAAAVAPTPRLGAHPVAPVAFAPVLAPAVSHHVLAVEDKAHESSRNERPGHVSARSVRPETGEKLDPGGPPNAGKPPSGRGQGGPENVPAAVAAGLCVSHDCNEPGSVSPRVSLADANEVLPPGGGTKSPVSIGSAGPEHNPVAVEDPCSPQGGRLGAIAHQFGGSHF